MFCTIETIWFERRGGTCCTEHRLGPKRYVTMTVMWTIILAWLALQLPLAVLIGKSIVRYGRAQEASRSFKRPEVLPGCRLVLGLTW